jgi:DNA mismatch endonuclease (patch repair protein)
MSRNSGRDTKPELKLRKACWALGMRYRLNVKLPGRPDFVLPRHKIAVFVDGCFWHGCPDHYQAPATRADFWLKKLEGNRRRDSMVAEQLSEAGWRVVRVWEHTVQRDLPAAVATVILGTAGYMEVGSSGQS